MILVIIFSGLSDEELNTLKKDLTLLQKYKEEVNKLIEESRSEGLKHVDQIKDGKQLSQLPKAAFPKPPALPPCHPIPPARRPPVEVPKVFLSPHPQPPIQPSNLPSMNVPPPQTTPSAFRPLTSNPPPAPPMSFSTQPPPTSNFISNGSAQQQMMAQYMHQSQQRPNIPIFTPSI